MNSFKNISINSDALAYLKCLIGPKAEIINLEVRNKWLVALLGSGVYFWVLNK